MKELYPGEDYPRRRVRLEQWRRDYEQDRPAVAEPSYTYPGTGRQDPTCPRCQTQVPSDALESLVAFQSISLELERMIGELFRATGVSTSERQLRKTLQVLRRGFELCTKHGLHPATMANVLGSEGCEAGVRDFYAKGRDEISPDTLAESLRRIATRYREEV